MKRVSFQNAETRRNTGFLQNAEIHRNTGNILVTIFNIGAEAAGI